jgi:hypothetical protein
VVEQGEPYISNCNYDQAGEILQQIYGPLRPRVASPLGISLSSISASFTRDHAQPRTWDQRVAYVPADCRTSQGCRVHVIFHGCNQHRDKVGDAFVRDAGFPAWADSNRLVLLFPQVTTTTVNPQAAGIGGVTRARLPDAQRPANRGGATHAGPALRAFQRQP